MFFENIKLSNTFLWVHRKEVIIKGKKINVETRTWHLIFFLQVRKKYIFSPLLRLNFLHYVFMGLWQRSN